MIFRIFCDPVCACFLCLSISIIHLLSLYLALLLLLIIKKKTCSYSIHLSTPWSLDIAMEAMAHLQMIDLLLFEWSCCSIANREQLREGIYTTEWSSYFSSIESQGLLSQSGFVQRKHRENHDQCREKDRQVLAGWYRRWFPHVQASKLSISLPQNKGCPKIPWFIPHFVKHIHRQLNLGKLKQLADLKQAYLFCDSYASY